MNFENVEVEIIRKKIKNVYLRIKGGKVVVSCPLHMSDEDIMRVCALKKRWIMTSLKKAESKRLCERRYDDGEEIYILGEKKILHTDRKLSGSYYEDGQGVYLCVGEYDTYENRKRIYENYLREVLRKEIPSVLSECEKMTGLCAKEWRIRNMTTRWGSCNTKEGRIWLSLRLAEKPYECLRYVIIHELAHLKVKGHGKDFYKFIDSCYSVRYDAEKDLKG